MSTQLERAIRQTCQAAATELAQMVRKTAMEAVEQAIGSRGAAANGHANGKPEWPGNYTDRDVVRCLRNEDGLGVREIASALGQSTDNIKLTVARLVSEKRLRKTGIRRGTRYHLR